MTSEFSEGCEDVEDPPLSDTEPLLDGSEEIRKQDDRTSTVTVPQLLVSRHLQKPLIIVSFAMLSQQLSGEFHAYRVRVFDHYSSIQASTQVSYRPGHPVSSISTTRHGIVLYYSNEILSKSLPDVGPYVSLGITIINVLMTFPPVVLIEASLNQLIHSTVF